MLAWDRLSVCFGWVGKSLGNYDLWYRRRVHNSNLIRSCLLFFIIIFCMVKRGQLLNHVDLIRSTLELSSLFSYNVPGSSPPTQNTQRACPRLPQCTILALSCMVSNHKQIRLWLSNSMNSLENCIVGMLTGVSYWIAYDSYIWKPVIWNWLIYY